MAIDADDLEYHRAAGIPLLARFYRPEGQGPFPTVLEVHGGAWTTGDRLTMSRSPSTSRLTASLCCGLISECRRPPGIRRPWPM